MAERTRGAIHLVTENCTVCMVCARECPDWCIHIAGHMAPAAAPEGGQPRRQRHVTVLDSFAIDWSVCMYCGICVEVCPFDALRWRPDPVPAARAVADLSHDMDRLASPRRGVMESWQS